MLPRQTMSMLWYMILFSVYGLKKSVSQTIRYCFSVCAVYTAFLCRLCNWFGLCVILYPAVKQGSDSRNHGLFKRIVEGVDVADGVGNL